MPHANADVQDARQHGPRLNRARRVVAGSLVAAGTLLGGGLILGSATGCSCSTFASGMTSAKYTAVRTSTVPHQAGAPLKVTTGNGEITVRKAGTDTVTITAKLKAQTQARLDAASVVATRLGDGTLDIKAQWPGNKRESNEGCSFEIAIPDATNVTIETANGAIAIGGFKGLATLDTSNGSITVEGHDGKVRADTSNGAITLNDVPEASTSTSNGAIAIRLTDAGAGPVVAKSSNGAIRLAVGSGFAGLVECSTSNGGISCTASSAKVIKKTRNSGVYNFGTVDAAKSTLGTSNGSITINAR